MESMGNGKPKDSDGYLLQIADNVGEKTQEVIKAIELNLLPAASDGTIRIVELGTGGGESTQAIKDALVGKEGVEIIAVDLSIGILGKVQKRSGVSSVAADATTLPFKNGSLSGVNASAVFHEVSSYGPFKQEASAHYEEGVYGREAIIRVLTDVQRSLVPGGMLAYRDIHAPNDPQQKKHVRYDRHVWDRFARWFYSNFLEADRRVFPGEAPLTLEQQDGHLHITASVHQHRELQRHYLMLRDYVRTQLAGSIGLEVMREEWTDQTLGIKSHEITARGLFYQCLTHDDGEGYTRRILSSDNYDDVCDDVINLLLDDHSIFRSEMDNWKKREGKEVYTYASIGEMLELSVDAARRVDDGHVLFPQSTTDLKVIPRDYYNHYLRRVIDDPEFDGKQTIRFFKIPNSEATKVLRAFENNGSLLAPRDIRHINGLLAERLTISNK